MISEGEDEPAPAETVTLEDVRKRLGTRWDCRPITAGYVGIPRLNDGTPIPRYGQTPAELLKNILRAEQT